MNYNLNHNRLIFDNLPFKLRTITPYSFLQAIISPLVTLYNNFLAYKKQTTYDVSITGQTIVFEKHLQLKFSNSGIKISNVSFTFNQSYVYRKNEIGNAILNNYVLRKSEAGTAGYSHSTSGASPWLYVLRKNEAVAGYDFLVEIPLSVLSTGITDAQIRAEVERYKKIGTAYEIKYI